MPVIIWIILALVFLLGLFRPLWAFPLVELSLLLGQLARFSWGGITVPLLDLVLAALVAGWLVHRAFAGGLRIPQRGKAVFYAALIFIGAALVSLGLSFFSLTSIQVLKGSLYLVRWAILFGVFWLLTLELKKEKEIWWFLHGLALVYFLFALLGFLQLHFFPNFEAFEHLGWDPHRGRLLSTFFDPNYAGGFLVFGLALSGSLVWYLRGKMRYLYGFLALILLGALLLTYSRSAFLALIILIFLFSVWLHPAILGGGAILGGAVLFLSKRFRERMGEIFTLGQTVLYRFQSWKEGFILWGKNFLFGSGYNNLPVVKPQLFYLENPVTRSVSGFDSSLLTIAATTGLIGLVSYLWLLVISLLSVWRLYREGHNLLTKVFSLAFLGGTSALLVHSFFVNSLLFTPLSLVWWITLALALKSRDV